MGSADVCPVEWGITPTPAQGLIGGLLQSFRSIFRAAEACPGLLLASERGRLKSDTAEPGVRSPSKNPRFEGPVRETTPRYRVCVENVSQGGVQPRAETYPSYL